MVNVSGGLFAFVILFILFLLLCSVVFFVLSVISLVKTMKGHARKTRGIVFLILANVCTAIPVGCLIIGWILPIAVVLAADVVMIILFIVAGRKKSGSAENTGAEAE